MGVLDLKQKRNWQPCSLFTEQLKTVYAALATTGKN